MNDAVGAQLIIESETPVRVIDLTGKDAWSIGRSTANDIVLSDRRISRKHASIQVTPNGSHYLIDFGSRNPTFINNVLLSGPHHLGDCDRIRVCDVRMRYAKPTSEIDPKATAFATHGDGPQTVTGDGDEQVTVLIADVRDSTSIAKRMSELEFARLVNRWFTGVSDAVKRRGGMIDKYMGDAVMALWLHDQPLEHAEQVMPALHAATEIQAFTQSLVAEVCVPMRIALGMNSGTAWLGRPGDGGEATVMGEAVVRAFRLEKITRDLDIDVAIGMGTAELLRVDVADTAPLRTRTALLKGFDEPEQALTGTHAQLFDLVDRLRSSADA